MHILDTLKQPLVKTDIIGMFRQDRAHLLCQSVHLIVGLCRKQIEEHRRHTTKQVIVALAVLLVINTNDRIVESRFLRTIDNILYLFIVATDTFEHGFFEVLQPDTVEGCYVVRRIIRFKKRILSLLILVHIFHYIFFSHQQPFQLRHDDLSSMQLHQSVTLELVQHPRHIQTTVIQLEGQLLHQDGESLLTGGI